MEIHLDGPSAAALLRLGVHVDGPVETAVLARLAAAGDLAVPLGRLVAAIEATGVPQAEAAAIVRALLVRLEAGGAVERRGGGYRLVDPTLVHSVLQDRARPQAGDRPVPARGAGPGATVPAAPPGAGAPAPSSPDVAAYLQRIVVSRPPGTPAAVPPAVVPAPGLPVDMLAVLVRDGWTPVAEVPGATIVRHPAAAREASVVVLTPPSSRPTSAVPVPATYAPPPSAVPTHTPPEVVARQVVAQLLEATPTVVAEAATLPAAAALGRLRPGTQFVFDLRSVMPPPGVAEAASPRLGDPSPAVASAGDPAAGAVAGAAGVVGQERTRRNRRRGRARDLSAVFEALFGPRPAELLAAVDPPGAADGARTSGGTVRPAALFLVAPSVDVDAVLAPEGEHGLLVEVLVMTTDEPAVEEVLAFLDDGDGTRLLAPRT